MEIEMVVLDLDGTLLGSDGRLPRQNIEAIARVKAFGVGVMLATGKTWWSAVEVIAQLGLNMPGVYSQGLIICDANGGILREIALDFVLADKILTYLEAEKLPFIAYNNDGLLTSSVDAYNAVIEGKYGEPAPLITSAAAGRAQELKINKFLIGDKKNTAARRTDLEHQFGSEATVLQAIPEYVEIMPLGVSKGSGLAWLLQRLGISPEAVLAMGDGENDLEMLQMAGTAVTLANAAPVLQETADFTVGSSDDAGVAEALHRLIIDPRV